MSGIEIIEDGRLVTVRINRPDHHNSLDLEVLAELYHALISFRERLDLSVLVLTGSGNIFCPGGDVHYLARGGSPDPADIGENEAIYRAPAVLRTLPQVTVARINGACAGAGLGLAVSCDLRYGIDTARYTTAFLARGVSGDMSLPWSLQRAVGYTKAIELSLFGDVFTGADAKQFGLVNDCFTEAEFDAQVQRRIEALLNRNPKAMASLKNHYRLAGSIDAETYADLETRNHILHFDTSGFQAFVGR